MIQLQKVRNVIKKIIFKIKKNIIVTITETKQFILDIPGCFKIRDPIIDFPIVTFTMVHSIFITLIYILELYFWKINIATPNLFVFGNIVVIFFTYFMLSLAPPMLMSTRYDSNSNLFEAVKKHPKSIFGPILYFIPAGCYIFPILISTFVFFKFSYLYLHYLIDLFIEIQLDFPIHCLPKKFIPGTIPFLDEINKYI